MKCSISLLFRNSITEKPNVKSISYKKTVKLM